MSTQPSVYFLLPRRALSGLTEDSRWKPESAAAQRSPNKENEVFFKEIAAVLEKPYATVRWKYSNAMKKLKRHLEDTEEPAGKEEHPLWLQTKN